MSTHDKDVENLNKTFKIVTIRFKANDTCKLYNYFAFNIKQILICLCVCYYDLAQ